MSPSTIAMNQVAATIATRLGREADDLPENTDRQAAGTVLSPISIPARRVLVRAVYFPCPLDLDLLRASYPAGDVLGADPLVVSLPRNGHVVVLRFGAVVFWHCSEAACREVLEQIQRVLQIEPPPSEGRDALLVLLNQSEERVNFRDVWLRDLSLEHVRIISETFGQSVALKQCELAVTQALKNTTPIVQALQCRGELIPAAKSILKTVGFTRGVREALLAKLSLFDEPVEAWHSERLAQLHSRLYEHFDIKRRLSGLQEKLTFLSDLNQILLPLLQNRTSHRLEWTVILLIVLEVIFSSIHLFTAFR